MMAAAAAASGAAAWATPRPVQAVAKLAKPAQRRAVVAAATVALLALSAPLQLGIALAIAAGITAGATTRPGGRTRVAKSVQLTTEAQR